MKLVNVVIVLLQVMEILENYWLMCLLVMRILIR